MKTNLILLNKDADKFGLDFYPVQTKTFLI